MLLTVTAAKMLAEIALIALLGQGLLALLAGPARATNPIYRMLQWLTNPLLRPCRTLLPRLPERRLPYVAAGLLLLVWLLATGLKIRYCLTIGLAQCQ
jgi:uncharacterized protein YggT (Ycf19 family)